MDSFEKLIDNLDSFIKKYYKLRIIRGVLLSISIILGVSLIFSISEFLLHFPTVFRAILFFAFIFLFLIIIIWFIFIPILKLINIGKKISYEQASNIIAQHFTSIKDKLINVLELQKLKKRNDYNISLIEAAISQKSEELKLIPFSNAIKHKQNIKYLRYTAPITIIFFAILFISPSLITESSKRIIDYSIEYIEPDPFTFNLMNESLQFKKGDNAQIKLKITGKYIPNEVFINYSGNQFLMKQSNESRSEFTYEFKNLNNSFNFKFMADELNSKEYKINILPSPNILSFEINVKVPEYTGEKDTTYNNIGDIAVPYGSVLRWKFKTKDVDSLCLVSSNKKIKTQLFENRFTHMKRMFSNFNYSVSVANEYFVNHNLINFNIAVIPDLYPTVSIVELKDSANYYISYFKGFLNDDYGFSNLKFKYRVIQQDDENPVGKYKELPLPVNRNELKQEFFYTFDFSNLAINDNEQVEYYFQVWDNDAVSGSKSSRSEKMIFKIPSFEEMKEFENSANENIQNKLDKSIRLANEIKRDLDLLKERNLDGNNSDWENKQMLQNIMDKQDLLKQLTKEISQENKEKNKMQRNLSEKDKELMDKQKEIQELLEEIMTDELKELMKQLEDLQQKIDEELMNKLMEKYEFSYEEMSDRLDRTKELLKREQIENKIDNAINELNKLSEEQKDLAEETKDKSKSNEELLDKQKEISEKFDQVMKEYDEAKELNKELKKELKLDEFKEEQNEINQDLQDSEENLQKNKNNKSSGSQNNSSQKMKKLAEKMQNMMNANQMQQQSEDIESLRQIVDNLITFSFAQEDLADEFKKLRFTDPQYIDYLDKQLDLEDDFKIIEDSLRTLAQRLSQINKPITDEIFEIESNLRNVQKELGDRKIADARKMQNKIMTSSNNLALLLSELLKQMKNQMQGGGGSNSSNSKNKSQGKQDAFGDLKSTQKSLKEQMEKMLEQMKKGQGNFSKNAQNEQLAKMLAQQEIFRQMLKDLNAEFSLSPETQKILNEINKMAEENEKDIVHNRITPELYERQKKIETRLLEAENSETKRKTDDKRKSNEGKDKIYKSPEDVFKNSEDNNSFNESLYRKNIQLKNFYKKLYEDYSKSSNE